MPADVSDNANNDYSEVGRFSFNEEYILARKNDYDLFIGQFKRDEELLNKQTIPCVIRRYRTEFVDDKKIQRELKVLRSPINLHENFIQYFNHVATEEQGIYT